MDSVSSRTGAPGPFTYPPSPLPHPRAGAAATVESTSSIGRALSARPRVRYPRACARRLLFRGSIHSGTIEISIHRTFIPQNLRHKGAAIGGDDDYSPTAERTADGWTTTGGQNHRGPRDTRTAMLRRGPAGLTDARETAPAVTKHTRGDPSSMLTASTIIWSRFAG